MTDWSKHWASWRASPSSLLLAGAITTCALAIVLMPLSHGLRQKWIHAMHGREDSAVVFTAVQLAPKMYNFANRYAFSRVPLAPEHLADPPSSLPPHTEYSWLNHYPTWIMTANPLVLFGPGEPELGYLYLFSRWNGEDTVTGYHIKLDKHGRTRGRIIIKRLTP